MGRYSVVVTGKVASVSEPVLCCTAAYLELDLVGISTGVGEGLCQDDLAGSFLGVVSEQVGIVGVELIFAGADDDPESFSGFGIIAQTSLLWCAHQCLA